MAKENLTLRIDSEPNETTYNAMESAKMMKTYMVLFI